MQTIASLPIAIRNGFRYFNGYGFVLKMIEIWTW